MANPKKYLSDIHLEDYTAQYETNYALAEALIFDSGRDKTSLNGPWHYMVPRNLQKRPGLYPSCRLLF